MSPGNNQDPDSFSTECTQVSSFVFRDTIKVGITHSLDVIAIGAPWNEMYFSLLSSFRSSSLIWRNSREPLLRPVKRTKSLPGNPPANRGSFALLGSLVRKCRFKQPDGQGMSMSFNYSVDDGVDSGIGAFSRMSIFHAPKFQNALAAFSVTADA